MTNFQFIETATNRSRQLTMAAIVWTGLAAGAVFLFFFNPALSSNQFFPKCPFRLLTGCQCPGCGSTRAFYQLLHLHPIAAFKFNPLMVLTLPFMPNPESLKAQYVDGVVFIHLDKTQAPP